MILLPSLGLGACSLIGLGGTTPKDGLSVPGLRVDDYTYPAGKEPPYVLASLREDAAANFIGCLDDSDTCFVLGEEVDVEIRFEPQTGRYWFLDPGSGNTYFVDGELRTGDPYLVRRRDALAPYPQGDLVIEGTSEEDDKEESSNR
ncbi:hypothetical protein [Parvularcula lutaonensis]|uniref:Lipoprotein n=1 Tax=Parvularcula lutaonensis TaxID=491923 RepID=A0ABV7MDX4_9PROT|nr:hypothetical protein [Parvularcula lutaonensis]